MSASAAPATPPAGGDGALRLVTVASSSSSPEVQHSAKEQRFCGNGVQTAKYSYLSFVPM